MSAPKTTQTQPADDESHLHSPMKSRSGLQRLWRATGYSWAGLKAAWRYEAAFRQELFVGVPAIALALWFAPGRWQMLVLIGSVLLVLVVELLNSAIEALADAISPDAHPLLGRAKDLGSAAVMVALALAVVCWIAVFWP